MFTGDLLPAERAQALGLVNHVVPESELKATTETIAGKILANAPLAVRAAKQSTLSTIDLPYDDAVSQAHAILDRLLQTRDAKEGMQAFVEKRPPSWEAR
jgi:enoyl-CoA hydratase/carnithine racemase